MAICCVSLILPRCGVPPSTSHSSGFRGPPQAGFRKAQTCICLPAEASAQAGPFLSNLEKMTFSAENAVAG